MATGKAQNLEVKDIRTKDGNLRFGHIHSDQTKSSIMLQAQGGLEFITLEQTKERRGWIWSRCRGRYQVKCGDIIPEGQVALYLDSTGESGTAKGNIEIRTKGTFKVEAENIQLIARGGDNKNGLITLQSNEKILLDSKQINIKADEKLTLYSSYINITARNILENVFGHFRKLSYVDAQKLGLLPFGSNIP